MGNKKGGGIGSKAMNAPTTYFTGQPARRINEKGVSQIGQSLGNHSMSSGGKKLNPVEPVRAGAMGGIGLGPLGNQTSLEAGQGPGAGRSVSRCGSQTGVSPQTLGPSKGEIFPGFPGKR